MASIFDFWGHTIQFITQTDYMMWQSNSVHHHDSYRYSYIPTPGLLLSPFKLTGHAASTLASPAELLSLLFSCSPLLDTCPSVPSSVKLIMSLFTWSKNLLWTYFFSSPCPSILPSPSSWKYSHQPLMSSSPLTCKDPQWLSHACILLISPSISPQTESSLETKVETWPPFRNFFLA